MQFFRRFSSHSKPKIVAPKNAGVVFDSRASQIRFALPFKPWFFLCLVGFSGAMCGNYFFSNFVLRKNPPNVSQAQTAGIETTDHVILKSSKVVN